MPNYSYVTEEQECDRKYDGNKQTSEAVRISLFAWPRTLKTCLEYTENWKSGYNTSGIR